MRPTSPVTTLFPPRPTLRGRDVELRTLARLVRETAPSRVALVGPGGSGKSVLTAALGHAVARAYPGGVHWFRVGAWDARTVLEMLALRFGTTRTRHALAPALRAHLRARGATLVVLDNHEDDAASAQVLAALGDAAATVVLTARRCLLAGVLVYPVTAPFVTRGAVAFPRVASLTRSLRWNPLALDLADALVAAGASDPAALAAHLARVGALQVRPVEHEDDVPEVRALVDLGWSGLAPEARRMLGVLVLAEGDSVDTSSLAALARVRPPAARAAVARLKTLRLVQEPFAGRFALHAVVRHALVPRVRGTSARVHAHYVALLERDPRRFAEEQTHLFAAMDDAQRRGDLARMLRIDRLLAQL